MISRESLGLVASRPFTIQTTIDRVEVHHSVYPASMSPIEQIQEIEKLHLGKGWNGIFYNVGIDPRSGDLYELRGIGHRSTSAAPTALTVVFFADLRSDLVAPKAIEALRGLVGTYGGPEAVYGHQERPYATACPGPEGMAVVRAIRDGHAVGGGPIDWGFLDDVIFGPGDSNMYIGGLQMELRGLGFYEGDPTANFDARTEAAVRAFQAAAGLRETGYWLAADQQALVEFKGFLEALPADPNPQAELEVSATESEKTGGAPEAGHHGERENPRVEVEGPTVPVVTEPGPVEYVDPKPEPPRGEEAMTTNQKAELHALLTTLVVGAITITLSMIGLEATDETVAVVASTVASTLLGRLSAFGVKFKALVDSSSG